MSEPTPEITSHKTESDIEHLSYESAREELVTVVQTLERGGISLEETLRLWERGEALANRCEQWLTNAKAKLQQVRQSTIPPSEQNTSGGQA